MLKLRSWSSLRRKLFKFDQSACDKTANIEGKEISLEPMRPGRKVKSIVSFDKNLLKLMSCPLSGEELSFDEDRNVLVSKAIGMTFPINSAGMPLILCKWAIPLDNLAK